MRCEDVGGPLQIDTNAHSHACQREKGRKAEIERRDHEIHSYPIHSWSQTIRVWPLHRQHLSSYKYNIRVCLCVYSDYHRIALIIMTSLRRYNLYALLVCAAIQVCPAKTERKNKQTGRYKLTVLSLSQTRFVVVKWWVSAIRAASQRQSRVDKNKLIRWKRRSKKKINQHLEIMNIRETRVFRWCTSCAIERLGSRAPLLSLSIVILLVLSMIYDDDEEMMAMANDSSTSFNSNFLLSAHRQQMK